MEEQQQKDMQDLQKIGEEMGEKTKENMLKSAEEQMGKTTQVSYTTSNSADSGHKIVSVINTMFTLAIALIIPVLLMNLAKKKKDSSNIGKFMYYYFRIAIRLVIYTSIGVIINIFIPGKVGFYVACVIIGNIIYYLLKRKGAILKPLTTNNKTSDEKKDNFGVVLGSLNGDLIVKKCKTPGNVLVVGAPGKGKSQCLSIPTILNWKGSALVIDIKRELYAYTKDVQSKKGKVIVFDPEQNGHAYDPIRECDTVDSCQFLARSLIPAPKDTDPFWAENAQNILAAACFEGNRESKTLPEISDRILLTEPEVLIQELTNSKYRETKLLASSLKGTPEKTLGGIFTQLRGEILLFATDENVMRALSKSEWSAETLEEGATIYMRVSERQIETYKKVWNLIIVQVLRHLSSRLEGKDPAVLLLLDELPRLGKVEGYKSALTTLRSKNVTIFTAAQSLAQFDSDYGEKDTRIIMDSTSYKLCLSAYDVKTQEIFSKLAGKYEREKESKNTNWSPGNFVPGLGKSTFTAWEERFRPETLAYLEKPLYFPPDQEAFQIDKTFWMNIPYFMELQKESGGPTTFISDTEFLSRSELKREDISIETINNIQYKENNVEYEQIQKIYPSNKRISTDDEEDYNEDENKEEIDTTDNIGHIELFEKWHIK